MKVLIVPVQVEELVALFHGAAGVEVVGQLPEDLGGLQALDIEVRQGFLPQPQAQDGAGEGPPPRRCGRSGSRR